MGGKGRWKPRPGGAGDDGGTGSWWGSSAPRSPKHNTTGHHVGSPAEPEILFRGFCSCSHRSRHRRYIPRLHVLAFLAGIFVSAEVDSLRTRLLQPPAQRKTLSPIKVRPLDELPLRNHAPELLRIACQPPHCRNTLSPTLAAHSSLVVPPYADDVFLEWAVAKNRSPAQEDCLAYFRAQERRTTILLQNVQRLGGSSLPILQHMTAALHHGHGMCVSYMHGLSWESGYAGFSFPQVLCPINTINSESCYDPHWVLKLISSPAPEPPYPRCRPPQRTFC